jgi:hypothetical protein
MTLQVERRTRGGSRARDFTPDELAQADAAKAVLRQALEARWPLPATWAGPAWTIRRSRSQDGATLRIAILWTDGPTVDEVTTLADSLAWPAGLPIVLGLRRRPEVDHRRPVLHRIQQS